jgi:hypothetical protein
MEEDAGKREAVSVPIPPMVLRWLYDPAATMEGGGTCILLPTRSDGAGSGFAEAANRGELLPLVIGGLQLSPERT